MLSLHAQIKGVVSDRSDGKALVGASVYWLQAKKGTATNIDGIFELGLPPRLPDTLIITYIGYVSDTLLNINSPRDLVIRMQPDKQLNEVVVEEKKAAMTYNMIDPFNKQSLGKAELKKAACCNLSESFETNATVDVSYTDAVSGSKQMKVLGLDGAYTQVLGELMPGIRGLSTNYGLAHVPGTWVQAIDITKGTGSVVQGYEGISGVINIELEKPEKTERLFVNLYAGDAGRYEANIHVGHRFNKNWSTLLLTHANTVVNRNDFNKDGYLDVPLGYQFNVMNRWKYENPGKLMASFGINILTDERTGGHKDFKNKGENDNRLRYGVHIGTQHVEAFSKVGFGFKNQPYKSLGWVSQGRLYEHDAYYGLKSYLGKQQSAFTSLIYQSIINNSDHKIKTGGSFMYDYYDEVYQDSGFKRTEIVPGIFGEYNYDLPGKLNVLLGIRADFHNLYGTFLTPRFHLRYNPFRYTVLRLSAGRGQRVANILIEQPAALASNRIVKVTEKLNPEVAWNYGTSITQSFKTGKGNASFIIDFYRTEFVNQVVADLDASPQTLLFYNLDGRSFSNSVQAEFIYEPIKKLELRLAYKFQDAKTTYQNTLRTRPLVARDRLLFNAGYATRFDKWKFDATLKWFGLQRLPSTQANPEDMQMKAYSNTYYSVNAQITKAFKHWEWYIGAENIFDYTQNYQIIDAANPFGNNFDASIIWGPVMGRVIYTGIRFSIK